MSGKEEFIAPDKLMEAYQLVKDKLDRMTAQCEKLIHTTSDAIAERNQLRVLNEKLSNRIEIAEREIELLRDANRSLVLAIAETSR